MKVILLKDIKKLGKKDEIINVADGYARNYLFPNKLAVIASETGREILQGEKLDREKEHERKREEAKEIAKKLEDITLKFDVKTGKDGRVFGSISTKQIEAELKKKHDIALDKRKFKQNAPISSLGINRVEATIYDDVVGIIRVHLVEKN